MKILTLGSNVLLKKILHPFGLFDSRKFFKKIIAFTSSFQNFHIFIQRICLSNKLGKTQVFEAFQIDNQLGLPSGFLKPEFSHKINLKIL